MWFKLLKGKIEHATKDAAAFDVFYNGAVPLDIGDRPVIISTGIFTEFDPRLVAILKEKSGLALKGVEIKAGVIDADYRKEWGVVARFPVTYNIQRTEFGQFENCYVDPGWRPFTLNPGDKVAQFLLIEKAKVTIEVPNSLLAQYLAAEDERVGGFGSTDKSKA